MKRIRTRRETERRDHRSTATTGTPLVGARVRASSPRPDRVLTTLPYLDEPRWTSRVRILDRRRPTKLGRIVRMYHASGRYQTVVLDGASRCEQFAAVLIATRRRPPRLLLTDCTWKRGSNRLDAWLCQQGIRAMDGPHILYGVLSSDERERFPATWGVDPMRVVFTPFCQSMTPEEYDAQADEDGSLFSGGNSMRDYETLVTAARKFPDKIHIATHLLDGRGDLPPSIEAGTVSHDRFMALMRRAMVIVVPLPKNLERRARQQTYLNAMALGKLVIVSDAPGVRDHVQDRRTGLVVPPADPDALVGAIRWAFDPANAKAVDQVRRRARAVVREQFNRANDVDHLLSAIDDAHEGHQQSAEQGYA